MHRALTAALYGACLASSIYVPARAQTPDRIAIDGSTGVAPLVAALASAYRSADPQATITIGQGMGTKERIRALNEGKVDIAMASHGLDVRQIEKQGMAVHEIAKVAVVFGLNEGVAVKGLTNTQICDIYAGKVKNWNELGGADLAIVPMVRPESEVDTEVVRQRIPCFTKLQMSSVVQAMPKTAAMAQALATAQGAIGMTTMTVVQQSKGRIRAASLDDVAPTAENVQRQTYKLTRDSFLVARQSPPPAVGRFLDFVRSDTGAKVISANGAVPQARP